MRKIAILTASLLLAGALVVSNLSGAAGQTTEQLMFVDTVAVDPDGNGYATLDFRGSGLIDVFAHCGGANPQGGTAQIPSQVMTRRIQTLVVRVRVFNHVGARVTSQVELSCTIDLVAPAPVAQQQARRIVQAAADRGAR
jgi:hypothetical protein